MKNKTAFITGGTKGIGLGIAQKLLQEGINVCITGRNRDTVADTVARLRKISNTAQVRGEEADVRDYNKLVNAVENTVREFGGIDYLVANAGVGHFVSIEDLSMEQWHETLDVNLTGVFYTVKVALEEIKKTQGYIFTISSLAGTNFFEKGSAYNASKFGLTGFTQALMLDVRKYGVKTTTIMPGSVATEFNHPTPGTSDEWKIQKEDIGQLIFDLIGMHPRVLPSKVEVRPTNPSRTK